MTFKIFGKRIQINTSCIKTCNSVGLGLFAHNSEDKSGYPASKSLFYTLFIFNRSFCLRLTQYIYPRVSK